MICRLILGAFALAYAFALLMLAIGVFGLFGAERDPLAAVFLIPIGLPWTLWTGRLPEAVRPFAAALTPVVNLVILAALCRMLKPVAPLMLFASVAASPALAHAWMGVGA